MNKEKAIYESSEININHETGEITRTKQLTIKKVSADKFVKVYLEDMSGILGITSQTEFKVLYILWEKAIYGTNEILIYKEVKEEIGDQIGKSASGVANAIASLVKKGLIRNVARMKYMLNPKYFFKGEEIAKSKVIDVYFRYIIEPSDSDEINEGINTKEAS